MQTQFIDKLKDALDIQDRELKMSDEFREYPEWDSLTYLSVIAMLDQEYDLQIEEGEFTKFRTIADLFGATK